MQHEVARVEPRRRRQRHVPELAGDRDDAVVRELLGQRAAELAARSGYEHASTSRGERIGESVLQRCLTRGSAQQSALLVGGGRVVLLGDVVTEEQIGERLEAVRVQAGDVDRDRVVVADVLGEGLAGRSVEHDDARRSLQAGEEVVLAALVVVKAADDALARERDVRLARRLRQQALAPELHEPAALVLEQAQRDADQAFDHATLFTPVRAISAPISGSDSCVPASSHQPLTRWQASVPRSA